MGDHWQRLGMEIRAARRSRKLHLSALASLSGLGTSTLDNLEHRRKSSYDPATLSALEGALGWQTGSVERVLSGLQPLPVDDPDLRVLRGAWPELPPESRRMLAILADYERARARGR